MNSIMYPAPRWFRDAVRAWLADTPPDKREQAMSDLFTRIVNAQPPAFSVVHSQFTVQEKP